MESGDRAKRGGASTSSSVFPMVTKATLTGSVQSGKTPVVEYKEQTASAWSTAADVETSGASFSATIGGLRGGTAYDYRISVTMRKRAAARLPLPVRSL